MPTPGCIERLRWPTGPGIRVDSGIEEGQTVGTSFDSMLAKLIVFAAPTRAHALARMRFASRETVILGSSAPTRLIYADRAAPREAEGRVHTGFLGTEFEKFAPTPSAGDLALLEAARSQGLGRGGAAGGSAGGARARRDSPRPGPPSGGILK